MTTKKEVIRNIEDALDLLDDKIEERKNFLLNKDAEYQNLRYKRKMLNERLAQFKLIL